MKTTCLKLLATCALLGFATAAHAQLYTATGSTGVTSSFNFTIDPTLNRVTVLVNNTQAGVGGVTGSVTSFGFNIPPALAGTGSLLSTSGVTAGAWTYFAPYNLSAGGGGFVQDVGAGTGANPNGGTVAQGVVAGSSATFVFQFGDFASAAGFIGPNGVTARWQGVTGNRSDEAFGNPGTPGGPGLTPVPEPSTYGLFGAAALAVGLMVRRKRNGVAAVAAPAV